MKEWAELYQELLDEGEGYLWTYLGLWKVAWEWETIVKDLWRGRDELRGSCGQS